MKQILFTRQIHDADRAGKHFDVRLVDGDKAYSWATKKELPEEGKSIILWQQPTHDATYSLSDNIEIPKGQYGAGTTKLDFVRKATIEHGNGHFTMTTNNGERYLFKEVPKFGEGAWLFKNLGTERKTVQNKYLEKIATTVQLYKCPDTGKTKWIKAGDSTKGWDKVEGASKHIANKNKYLTKVAEIEKKALTRLVKEMIKRRGAGLPVSEAGFHELARRGASRSMLQYAKGIKKRDNKFMKQLGVGMSVNGPNSTSMHNISELGRQYMEEIAPEFKGRHFNRVSTSYNPMTKEIDSYGEKAKGLIRSHEVHEAVESKKTGAQDLFDRVWFRTPRELKSRLNTPVPASAVTDPNYKADLASTAFSERLKKHLKTDLKYPVQNNIGQHMSLAVLGRESNDIRTNPFAKTLSSGVNELRRGGKSMLIPDETEPLKKITGKRYGIDKFTNKDLEKLRKTG